MALNMRWGNSLEAMADELLVQIGTNQAAEPAEVFAKRNCIVVPNRIQQAWLQQRFLYDLDRSASPVPHVLTGCDFTLMNLFVTDWLYRMDAGADAGHNDPESHPFSVKSMRWRIYKRLRDGMEDDSEVFAPLRQYVRENPADNDAKPHPRKCFKLAGRIAALMDQYTTYRPQLLTDWEQGRDTGTDDATAWEPALWRELVKGRENQTYLSAFRRMGKDLQRCGIQNVYHRVLVFAPAMLPPAHLEFFRLLGDLLPVDFYLFNPSDQDWFDRQSLSRLLTGPGLLDRPEDPENWEDSLHPLLGVYGRGCRDTVAAALDLTGGQIKDVFVRPTNDAANDRVLHALQRSLVDCNGEGPAPSPCAADDSIQIHLCHGKMREVEILRDQLLRCFDETPGLQPRHIQVQVTDLDAYAPYIEAVFTSTNPNARSAIPFAIADRVAAGESRVAEAFRMLLNVGDSRFAISELLDLLHCESVGHRFNFTPDEVIEAGNWLMAAGIRWGRDREHRKSVTDAEFTEITTWRHGLDRLFLGYAEGETPDNTDWEGLQIPVVPCDCVEGDNAIQLGHLARFYETLSAFADFSAVEHSIDEWATRLETLVNDCFAGIDETYRDIAMLKVAIHLLRTSGVAAEFTEAIPLAVVRDFLTGHLEETAGGGDLNRNTVIFNSLRPGSSAPRPVQCLLGMGDALFPHADNRPAYDLLRRARRMGDRSAALEDRVAFLEALMNARQKLLLFYPAFSEEDNRAMAESVAVRELTEYLDAHFGGTPDSPVVRRIRHRLQPFHPDYFTDGANPSALFSYSRTQCEIARALLSPPQPPDDLPAAPQPAERLTVTLNDLTKFFENPARYYYKSILGAEPVPHENSAPKDEETTEPNALEKWKIVDKLLDTFVEEAEEDRNVLIAEMTANGQLPLGEAGKAWVDKLSNELQESLAVPAPPFGTLKEALMAQKLAQEQGWTVELNLDDIPVTLSGAGPQLTANNQPYLFTFRYSSAAKHLLGSWWRHLLATAAGEENIQTLHIQKNGKNLDSQIIRSVDKKNAKKWLVDALRIYLSEGVPPPPFTPECSWAYVQARRKDNPNDSAMKDGEGEDGKVLQKDDPHDPAMKDSPQAENTNLQEDAPNKLAMKEAMKKAKIAWKTTFGNRKDDQDPYFRAVFPADGPMHNEKAFAKMAERIMGPICDHL